MDDDRKFRVIVAGSRDYNNFEVVELNLKCLLKYYTKLENTEIISGGCRGVDKLAEKFADKYGYKFKEFPADWSLGKRAGYIRNKQMADYAAEETGILIAFWDMKSRGTKLMINLAKQKRLKCFVIDVTTLEELKKGSVSNETDRKSGENI